MNFFQKVGNAFSRFLYGRNGADHLGMAALWLAILLDIVNIFVKNGTAHAAVASVAMVLTLWVVFRMFSRNLQRRRAENAWFLTKFVYPVQRRRSTGRQQRMYKDHKYFTCPNCRTVCRVPRGKGKIVITCPKCHREIHGRS